MRRLVLRGLQSVAGVLKNFCGATLWLLPPQTVHKEELRGGLGQRGLRLLTENVTVPLLTLHGAKQELI